MEYSLRPSTAHDLDWLLDLRTVELRADLERHGIFDPVRVRTWMSDAFAPENTQIIRVAGEDVGSISVRHEPDARWIEHFYLPSRLQGHGIGSQVLAEVLSRPDHRPFRLMVLQGSAALRLYARHGFTPYDEDDHDVWMTRPASVS
ncbi:GNAT family N-acetyltransferase [Salinibacterium sp. NK8237]|uniref:GNAT family N-acetyltransferase n=1 Tax=Salinibacterium sp. NK8237 TaxID=2792038 RepID=UPI0018CE2E5F|nr:GNAT family N-acetyltransferase [Salinibacterium sp. NK8237]MBH0131268.1 GNAT family N-acetyltransferase [Salinibacterium sp. NK8237]